MMTSAQEWKAMWPLVLAATIGLSGISLFAYSSGIFMDELIGEFGWSRSQYSAAFTLQMLLGLFTVPAIGILVDRFGPRRIVLIGMLPFGLSFAALGLVRGAIWEWWLLCALLALSQAFVTQTIWISAIVSRFHASRGLAMAITLSGLSLGSVVWPPITAALIETIGWRLAFAALPAIYLAVATPLVLAFFFGATGNTQKRVAKPTDKPASSALNHIVKSRAFLGLLFAGGLFSCAYYGMTLHLVPTLQGMGIGLATAATLAGTMGIFAVAGRLVAGHLLDRLPTRPIGVVAFLLPAVACILLLTNSSMPGVVAAVALLGLAAGAEMDIVTFIAARQFGQDMFASVYGIFVAIIAASASLGPLLGGALFDLKGSYHLFQIAVIAMVMTGAVIIAILPLGENEGKLLTA